MSRLIAIVACTRPALVGRMVASLEDCDEVRIGFDPTRNGQAETRNALLSGISDDDVIRVCDDDDEALNSRELWQEFSIHGDALLFSYEINGRKVIVPSNPYSAAIDHVISCNWMVRGRLIKRLGGFLFDPVRTKNTGTWAWLRILQTTMEIQVEPSIVGYRYFKRTGTESQQSQNDKALEVELRKIAGADPERLANLSARFSRAA